MDDPQDRDDGHSPDGRDGEPPSGYSLANIFTAAGPRLP